MTIEQAFKLFPEAKELHSVGGEVFLTVAEATDYSKHFKLGKPEKHERPAEEQGTKPKSTKPKSTEPKSTVVAGDAATGAEGGEAATGAEGGEAATGAEGGEAATGTQD